MKAGIITQARMGSTRLPGKILLRSAGHTLLYWHLLRLQSAGIPVIVAITTLQEDDLILNDLPVGIRFYRGNETDVLDRYYNAAKQESLDIIIRVTSDCPLIDGAEIASALDRYLKNFHPFRYVCNVLNPGYSLGFSFEIFSFVALEEAWKTATLPGEREHVTPWMHQNPSGKFQVIMAEEIKAPGPFRVTVDTAEDYKLVNELIENHNAAHLTRVQILQLLASNPTLAALNSEVVQKKWNE